MPLSSVVVAKVTSHTPTIAPSTISAIKSTEMPTNIVAERIVSICHDRRAALTEPTKQNVKLLTAKIPLIALFTMDHI